jgi:hypothetical protein
MVTYDSELEPEVLSQTQVNKNAMPGKVATLSKVTMSKVDIEAINS